MWSTVLRNSCNWFLKCSAEVFRKGFSIIIIKGRDSYQTQMICDEESCERPLWYNQRVFPFFRFLLLLWVPACLCFVKPSVAVPSLLSSCSLFQRKEMNERRGRDDHCYIRTELDSSFALSLQIQQTTMRIGNRYEKEACVVDGAET